MKKTIMCFGDSNTWGANPLGGRHDESIRWTALLAKALGDEYHVFEQGLNGRTTVFDDPFIDYRNGKKGLPYALRSCYPLDLIIIMLGSNDTKTIFNVIPNDISLGLESLLPLTHGYGRDGGNPKILIVSPIYVSDNILETCFSIKFGLQARDKSHEMAKYYKKIADRNNTYFMDAALYAKPSNQDGIHMMPDQHKLLADAMLAKVKEIL